MDIKYKGTKPLFIAWSLYELNIPSTKTKI